jgi:hypothetical protein
VQLVHLVLGEIADAQLWTTAAPPFIASSSPTKQLGQRGLALAVLAQKRDPVVLVDPQVEPAQHRRVPS